MSIFDRLRTRLVALITRQPGAIRTWMSPMQGGVRVTEDTALTLSAVWACVRIISETLAGLPWHVYRSGSNGDATPLSSHGVEWLLNTQPNTEMTAFTFRETVLAHALLWGNGYAEIQRGLDGRPTGLWPLLPDRTEPRRDQETAALYYRYVGDDGVERRIAPQDIFHLHGLGFDGLSGYSPVRLASRAIGLGIAQDAYGQAFYGNGTAMGGLVEMPASMNPQQVLDMEKYLNDAHRGPDKAFRLRVVHSGAKYTPMAMPMTDAQFLESRKFTVSEIARWYRVPPHKIAELDRSTNNNIEQQAIEFVVDCLVPWAIRMEQEANIKLFGQRAQGATYTRIAVNALMRGDGKSRSDFYRQMISIGAMTINEVRALEELNGIGEAGDQHLVQVNQTTLERLLADPPDAAEPAGEPGDPGDVGSTASDGTPPPDDDSSSPSNVIRMRALAFIRQQQERRA